MKRFLRTTDRIYDINLKKKILEVQLFENLKKCDAMKI